MTFAPYTGAFVLYVLRHNLMSLPLDPHDCPGTPEYQELAEERARRAYYRQLAALEEYEETHALRRGLSR